MDYSKPEQHAKLLAGSYAYEADKAAERIGKSRPVNSDQQDGYPPLERHKGRAAAPIWLAGYMVTQAIVYLGSSLREIASDYMQRDSTDVAEAIRDLAAAQREHNCALRLYIESQRPD